MEAMIPKKQIRAMFPKKIWTPLSDIYWTKVVHRVWPYELREIMTTAIIWIKNDA